MSYAFPGEHAGVPQHLRHRLDERLDVGAGVVPLAGDPARTASPATPPPGSRSGARSAAPSAAARDRTAAPAGCASGRTRRGRPGRSAAGRSAGTGRGARAAPVRGTTAARAASRARGGTRAPPARSGRPTGSRVPVHSCSSTKRLSPGWSLRQPQLTTSGLSVCCARTLACRNPTPLGAISHLWQLPT